MWLKRRPTEAQVVQPRLEEMAELLAASGQVRGRDESRLAPEVSGTVAEILVEEGETVKAGEVVATLDTARLDAQVLQARQKVAVAEAQLRVAQRPPLASEYAQVQAEVERAKRVAEANLESARQALQETSAGPRSEQIEQARAQLRQARFDREQRERDLSRQQELYRSGAVPKQTYEEAATANKTAQAAEEALRQRLAELENGSRPEDIAQARESVRAAQAEVLAAQEGGRARLQQLDDSPRPEDIALARSQVQEAEAALVIALRNREQAVVKAPYDGTVGSKLLRPGDPASPTAPILTFASQPALEVRVELDESERSRVSRGTEALVRANGYSESFQAKVERFAGEIDPIKGTMEARLRPENPPSWLLPGQTVDVNLILSPQAERMLIPLTSVMLQSDQASVYVVEDGRVAEKRVQVSSPSQAGYLVLSGLKAEEFVVQFPQGFKPGQRVRTKRVDFS